MPTLKARYIGLTSLLFLAACVTINVYFPNAEAKKAADELIDQVWKEEPEGAQEPSAPVDGDQSRAPSRPTPLVYLLNQLISPAHAGIKFTISSPAAKKLVAGMTKRAKKLVRFYDNGAVGLTNDALVSVRDPKLVPLRLRNKVKQLTARENQDRLALYKELARANGHPEWEAEIRKTFAERWIKKAKRGWWYQDEDGRWQQKTE